MGCRIFAAFFLMLLAVFVLTSAALANGRHPQVQLGDIPVDVTCRGLDGQEIFVANARVADRREIEVRDGIATLFVPLGNISQLELRPLDSAGIFVDAALSYASGESASVQLRVKTDSGEPLTISGVVPGRAVAIVELGRCQQIRVAPAGSGPQPHREPTPAAAE